MTSRTIAFIRDGQAAACLLLLVLLFAALTVFLPAQNHPSVRHPDRWAARFTTAAAVLQSKRMSPFLVTRLPGSVQ